MKEKKRHVLNIKTLSWTFPEEVSSEDSEEAGIESLIVILGSAVYLRKIIIFWEEISRLLRLGHLTFLLEDKPVLSKMNDLVPFFQSALYTPQKSSPRKLISS